MKKILSLVNPAFAALLAFCALFLSFANEAAAQKKDSFSYNAQKKLIHPGLGRVYLGMPFHEFVKHYDLALSDVGDTRFNFLTVTFPVDKGDVRSVTVKVHGLAVEGREEYLKEETVPNKEDPNFPDRFTRLDASKMPKTGFVYQMSIQFKPEYDLKTYVLKTFGTKGTVHDINDEYHFYDIEWAPKTTDGLRWLVRSFHEKDSRLLMLIGRIDGTEWGLDSID